jgi:hypothetical protein
MSTAEPVPGGGIALAEALDQPLITLDREILERSSRVIEAEAPDVWVHRESSR